MDASGSLQKIVLNGVVYRVHGDSDSTNNFGKYENELLPTSGGNIMKKTFRAQTKEGIDIAANRAEMENLKALSESLSSFPMVLMFADGSKDIASGGINLGSWSSADNKATIMLLPENAWEAFTA